MGCRFQWARTPAFRVFGGANDVGSAVEASTLSRLLLLELKSLVHSSRSPKPSSSQPAVARRESSCFNSGTVLAGWAAQPSSPSHDSTAASLEGRSSRIVLWLTSLLASACYSSPSSPSPGLLPRVNRIANPRDAHHLPRIVAQISATVRVNVSPAPVLQSSALPAPPSAPTSTAPNRPPLSLWFLKKNLDLPSFACRVARRANFTPSRLSTLSPTTTATLWLELIELPSSLEG